jgi:hypothetical protein
MISWWKLGTQVLSSSVLLRLLRFTTAAVAPGQFDCEAEAPEDRLKSRENHNGRRDVFAARHWTTLALTYFVPEVAVL